MIFSPAFLDSSSCWNTSHNQLQLQQIASSTHITSTPAAGPGDGGGNNSTHSRPQEGLMATAVGGGGVDGGGCAGDGDGGGSGSGNSKPMSMPERARLARVPQPKPGLNCPRCDSINTKFCYFNNYALTQPRYFCRACRRYWTHGGALRNVPVGSGCRRRRHAKRSAKPKAASAAGAATIGTSFATSMMPSTITCTTGTATAPSGLQYSMFDSTPPFTDSFDPANLGLSFPARMLFADGGAYAADGSGHHHNQQQQGKGNGVEQWAAAQMHSFPFLHGMDHQMSGPPAAAMPTTMAANAMLGMFQLGLQSDGGGNGEDDGGDHQFHHHATLPAKRDHEQPQQDYSSSRGMYGNTVNGGDGYNFYSSTSNAVRNY